ncbi:Chemotaxis response regulator protein-glutamate methylesterase [Stratiformator vulcanicus]|uniref:protein-glutamate methylesterase n=2 Tax=Stratiformator vulcanicus TaxID=2527980 RepID=A0A517R1S4_9PLAN|nr:Chemotaxis response regulator protein-glutamate methylesterase [Stratiformator vulcanicus]
MNGADALAWLGRHKADVVVLDVEMPVMDGLTALQHIQARYPKLTVIMASSLTQRGAETTVRALRMGAAGCVAKPVAGRTSDGINRLAAELTELVIALGQPSQRKADLSKRANSFLSPAKLRPVVAESSRDVTPQAIVIGASTGGPRALAHLLQSMSRDITQPIFIVQHMPAMFTPMLAEHLGRDADRPSFEATDGMVVQSGTIYVAPGGFHLKLVRSSENSVQCCLTEDPQEHYCRPSVNPLFRSAAQVYKDAILGIMLTGMGQDGIEGAAAIRKIGGKMIAQDEATSTVWGMPGAVAKAGLANSVLPLAEIPAAISEIVEPKAVLR